jgi:cobalt-zinc-cadmium efflux system outer membrane protein
MLLAAGLLAATFLLNRSAFASPCAQVSRANLVGCALDASLVRRADRAAITAAEGRLRAAEVILPSNPSLGLTGARRSGTEGRATNWSVSLGVELEIAGQRSARRAQALAERDARTSEMLLAEREIAAEAWRAYFEVIAAGEAHEILMRLERTSERVAQAAQAAAERGRASGVEADIAESAYLNVTRRRLLLAQEGKNAALSLALLVGLAANEAPTVAGSLDPLKDAARVEASFSMAEPPQVVALEAERRAFAARASTYRRSRVPNPTVSVFAERDGFNEQVLGVGIGLPLPLPGPLGPSRSGEIAESEALSARAGMLAENARRTARTDVLRAREAFRAAMVAESTFTRARLERAEQALNNLAEEVEVGRLSVREAVLFQGPLLELLLGAVEARKASCLASVALVKAAGLSLDGSRQ